MTRRASPDQLLQRIENESRHAKQGKLKIYLGAAPGVGKTHEMLEDARAVRSKGLDVIIGIIESHGRTEVEDLSLNFERLPKQIINYYGKELSEFDIDAALARHPGLIMMDEMAHTNAPGLRHEKRWQDIKELLDNGIDVYTTLNVQHIESLSDAVAQIVHAPVRETIPNFMFEMADSIELVDIPPEELLKRLSEGKVYIPAQAELAKEHFFKKGNLTALRELALRTTAERVGSQVMLYRKGEGIRHIWPVSEKILVCVGPGSQSVKLIKAAKRLATSLHAKWIAVYVTTPRVKVSEENKISALNNLKLAEQLGADTHILTGYDVVRAILIYAREQNITQIMIFKNIRPRFQDIFSPNLADALVRQSGEIDVYIMTGIAGKRKIARKSTREKETAPWYFPLIPVAVVALITSIDFLVYPFMSNVSLAMLYLLGITVVSLIGNFNAAMVASFLSVLAYDFFFVPPRLSFSISDLEYLFTLLVMLLVALIISNLTTIVKRQSEASGFVIQQMDALQKLSRQLSINRGIANLLDVSVRSLADIFACEVVALLSDQKQLVCKAKSSPDIEMDKKEESVAQWVLEHGHVAGLGTNTLPSAHGLYIPLIASKKTIGVLRLTPIHNRLLSPEERHLLDECASLIALSIEADQHE